jgi:hypothetical protein
MQGMNNILAFGAAKKDSSWSMLGYKEKVKQYGQSWWTTYAGYDAQQSILSDAAKRAQAAASLPEGVAGRIDPSQVYAETQRLATQQFSQFGISPDMTMVRDALAELQGLVIDVTFKPLFDVSGLDNPENYEMGGIYGSVQGLARAMDRINNDRAERQTVPSSR